MPQIIENYKRKKVDALSPAFILQWLLGDIFNLIGCILTNQLPTQTYLAVFFCINDSILMGQYVIYREKSPKKIVEASEVLSESEDSPVQLFSVASILLVLQMAFTVFGTSASSQIGRSLLSTKSPSCENKPYKSTVIRVFGAMFSWFSGVMYVFSRLPQILRNYQRQSVEGLAVIMFVITVLGNLFYGLSIIFRWPKIDSHFFEATLPYIIGSCGTVVFDITILAQAHFYKSIPQNNSPLLWESGNFDAKA